MRLIDQHLSIATGPVSSELIAMAGDPFDLRWIESAEQSQQELKQFISGIFRRTYGADVTHFNDNLIGCRDEQGSWMAALGFTALAEKRAFLEHYLDSSIESAIETDQARAGKTSSIRRREIVEVGNLATCHPGASRWLILQMIELLHGCGFRWVAFTLTRSLANSFRRLHFQPLELIEADPDRLPPNAGQWGSYYNTRPTVMYGDIRAAYQELYSHDS